MTAIMVTVKELRLQVLKQMDICSCFADSHWALKQQGENNRWEYWYSRYEKWDKYFSELYELDENMMIEGLR